MTCTRPHRQCYVTVAAKFQKHNSVNSRYVVTRDPLVVSQRPLNNGGSGWPPRARAISLVSSIGHTGHTGQIQARRIIVKSQSLSGQKKKYQSGYPFRCLSPTILPSFSSLWLQPFGPLRAHEADRLKSPRAPRHKVDQPLSSRQILQRV